MKTYSRLTLVLTFLLLLIASGILFTAPTFGDSLSGSETFDAQQFLSEAKAQQVAEAGKKGALIGLIVSLVIAYVMSPIDQQRWLKVAMVIVGVTGGYFGGKIAGSGPLASEEVAKLQQHSARSRVRRAGLDMDKEFKRMNRMGVDQRGVEAVLGNLLDIRVEKRTAVDPTDVQMFDEQIRRLVPALQKQLDAIVAMSDDATDFANKFDGAGVDLAVVISQATGIPIKGIIGQIKKQLKAQALGKQIEKDRNEHPERRSAAMQTTDATAAGQRLATGRTMTIGTGASARNVSFGSLSEAQMERFSDPTERAKLENLRASREKEQRLNTIPRAPAPITPAEQKAIQDAADKEGAATDAGDTVGMKEGKEEVSAAMRKYFERVLGKENVTHADVASGVKASYKEDDPDSINKFVDSRRTSLAKERKEAEDESMALEKHFQQGAGALGAPQLLTLLQNPQLFDALARDIDLYMKSMSKEKIEPVEDTKQVTPDSAQKPTAAETMQSIKPQKRPNRRRRMKTR